MQCRFFGWALLLFALIPAHLNAQLLEGSRQEYDRGDTLRGSLRPERTNYDVLKYNLDVKVNIETQYIQGSNTIKFKVLGKLPVMQIDLFANMNVDSIIFNGQKLFYRRAYNAVFVKLPHPLQKGTVEKVKFYYSGHPIVAEHPPWDGGFVFTHDKNGNPWVAVAVQGTGASLWFPNKDYLGDEPETTIISVTTPDSLMNVSNGRLVDKKDFKNGGTQWTWKVTNPINNYNITLNIGDYTHFSRQFRDLDLNYYVLPYHLKEAKEQFQQVIPMMRCFYEKFGPYPFPEDSYKLVEAPYLGMEHQSAVAYGNHYQNGYAGTDLSGTGIGLKFDFIIIHESAHEWFGNSITAADIADLWIHEAFATYAESVYVECRFGKEAAMTYLKGIRRNVKFDGPIIGDYGVNSEGSGDMYFKGANMINTLRSIVDNEEEWWDLIKDFSMHFRHQITNTEEVVRFFNERIKYNVKPFFKQYLRYVPLPKLKLKKKNGELWAQWEVDVKKFDIPVDLIGANGEEIRIYPTTQWQAMDLGLPEDFQLDQVKVDRLGYYIDVDKIKE